MTKNYEEFCNFIEANILALMPDGVERKAFVRDVHKNNGVVLKGLVLLREDTNASPNFYLEPYYEEYAVGKATLEEVLIEIAERYSMEEAKCSTPFDLELLQEANVIGCLVGAKYNEDLLKDIPYIPCGEEFAIIFKFYLGEIFGTSGSGSVTITDSLADSLGLDTESLMQLAMENTPRILPASMKSMSNVLQEIVLESILREEDMDTGLLELSLAEEVPMYVVTNQTRVNGAFAMFYPGLLDSLFEKFQCDLVMMPGSIHECLICPYTEENDLEFYTQMVQEVNQTQVPQMELLGERAFLLKRGAGDMFNQLKSNMPTLGR